jgi:hypothetical protein
MMKKSDYKKNIGLLELLEDREALLKAKKEGGQGITLQEYMKKRFKPEVYN